MSPSSNRSQERSETGEPKPPSTSTINIDTLHFEGLIIDVTTTVEGYTDIATQDIHCVNTYDRETYVAGFSSTLANDRASKLAQELQDITSVLE